MTAMSPVVPSNTAVRHEPDRPSAAKASEPDQVRLSPYDRKARRCASLDARSCSADLLLPISNFEPPPNRALQRSEGHVNVRTHGNLCRPTREGTAGALAFAAQRQVRHADEET